MKSINLAVIAGDGIGPEVTSVGIAALEKALSGVELDITTWARTASSPPAKHSPRTISSN